MKENEGSKGTLIPGKGAVYEEKWAEFKKLDREYQDYKQTSQKQLESISQRLGVLNERNDRKLEEIKSNRDAATDLITQLTVLDRLGQENFVIAKASNAITLLFIIIDVAPIFAKVLNKRSIYDVLLENTEVQHIEAVEGDANNLKRIELSRQQLEWEQYEEATQQALRDPQYSLVMQEVARKMIVNLKQQLLAYVERVHYPKREFDKTVKRFHQHQGQDMARSHLKQRMTKKQASQFVKDATTMMEDLVKKPPQD